MAAVRVSSEIAPLETVILHRPGPEIEIMTPETAFELLYDDILYQHDALTQHNELEAVLKHFANVYLVEDLLTEILDTEEVKRGLLHQLTDVAGCPEVFEDLLQLDAAALTRQLFTGTPLKKDTLTRYLSERNYALTPLPNFFFMRDSAMIVNGHVVLGSMASDIRRAESIIMNWIFKSHPSLNPRGFFLDASNDRIAGATFEGGDVLVARADTILIGMGERTTPQGVDYLIERLRKDQEIRHVIAVRMPKARATIHLDMIFTFVDEHACVVYPPLILNEGELDVFHIYLKDEKTELISQRRNLLAALAEVNIEVEPIACGGNDALSQAREQWQSGANFFSIAPGKMIGYDRNPETLKELNRHGYPTVMAKDIIAGDVDIGQMDRFVVAISSSELVRGGGGCRCMTMPVLRQDVHEA